MRKSILLIVCLFCAFLPGKAQTYMQYVDSADKFIKKAMWKEAEETTIAALRTMPGNKLNYLLWSNLGDIRANMEQYDEAIEAFTIGLASRPDYIPLLNKRAYTLLKMNRTEEAVADIDAALQIDSLAEWPMKMHAILSLQNAEEAAKQKNPNVAQLYKNAEKEMSRLAKHHPNCATGFEGLGRIAIQRGDVEQADKLLRQAIEIEPESSTYFTLILLNIENGRHQTVREDVNNALKRYPKDGNLYLLKSVIHKMDYETKESEKFKKIAIGYGANHQLVEQFFYPNKQKY